MSITKDTVKFIEESFCVDPEFLFEDSPNIAVFRNKNNKKWFAVIMGDMPLSRLGLSTDRRADFINLKCGPLMSGSLVDGVGIFKGYHMNKEHWISVLLDGTVPPSELEELVLMSYNIIDSKRSAAKRTKRRIYDEQF